MGKYLKKRGKSFEKKCEKKCGKSLRKSFRKSFGKRKKFWAKKFLGENFVS